jgi:hypothetical protein
MNEHIVTENKYTFKKERLFENIINLPPELILCIQDFVPKKHLVFTNRENYILYHIFLKPCILKYENYIRDTIRRDNFFVVERIIQENFKIWKNINHYMYKNMIFKNYIYFILHYCIENESTNCREVIMDFLKQQGFAKNLHKKNIVKYIRWKN